MLHHYPSSSRLNLGMLGLCCPPPEGSPFVWARATLYIPLLLIVNANRPTLAGRVVVMRLYNVTTYTNLYILAGRWVYLGRVLNNRKMKIVK